MISTRTSPLTLAVSMYGRFGWWLAGSSGAGGALLLGYALLQLGEVELAAEEGCDRVEGGGSDEAEHRVAEAECDPGGDEQKADQRRELLTPATPRRSGSGLRRSSATPTSRPDTGRASTSSTSGSQTTSSRIRSSATRSRAPGDDPRRWPRSSRALSSSQAPRESSLPMGVDGLPGLGVSVARKGRAQSAAASLPSAASSYGSPTAYTRGGRGKVKDEGDREAERKRRRGRPLSFTRRCDLPRAGQPRASDSSMFTRAAGGHAQRAAGSGELAAGEGQQPEAQRKRDDGGHAHSFLCSGGDMSRLGLAVRGSQAIRSWSADMLWRTPDGSDRND
jgi:hypothetical protein